MIKILYPVNGVLTQGFGGNAASYAKFNLPGHNGLDWGVRLNTPVRAAQAGVVDKIGWDPTGYGNYIKLKHTDEKGGNYYTLYAHLNTAPIKIDYYAPGDVVGRSGTTGNSTGPHLHFELIIPWEAEGKWKGRVDPTTYLTNSLEDIPDDNTHTDEAPTITENSVATVNADIGLRVRYEPNTTSKILTVAPYGSKLNVGKIKDGWAEIIFYASAEYLENS